MVSEMPIGRFKGRESLFFGPNVNDDSFIEVPFPVNLHKIVQMLSVWYYFSVFDRFPITLIVCSVTTSEYRVTRSAARGTSLWPREQRYRIDREVIKLTRLWIWHKHFPPNVVHKEIFLWWTKRKFQFLPGLYISSGLLSGLSGR